MAHITVGNLESANAELFFENPESFITELGADEIGKIQGGNVLGAVGGLVGGVSVLNGSNVGVNVPVNVLGNQGGDNDGVDNKVTYPTRW